MRDDTACRTITAKLHEIMVAHVIPDDLVDSMRMGDVVPSFDTKKERFVATMSMRLAAFGKMTKQVEYRVPRTWVDALKLDLSVRLARFRHPVMAPVLRFLEPEMKSRYVETDTYQAVCPHLGQGIPDSANCVTWAVSVLDGPASLDSDPPETMP